MLTFLQQNAEWMCAIAIVIFTIVQCIITYAQYRQELRFRRFELAHKLDVAVTSFFGTSETTENLLNFLSSNQSNFKYLLKENENKAAVNLMEFVLNVRSKTSITTSESIDILKKTNDLTNILADNLCNASYGIQKIKKEKNNGN